MFINDIRNYHNKKHLQDDKLQPPPQASENLKQSAKKQIKSFIEMQRNLGIEIEKDLYLNVMKDNYAQFENPRLDDNSSPFSRNKDFETKYGAIVYVKK